MSWRADLAQQQLDATDPVTIKALPLWQPWATLVAIGAKHYETRAFAPPRIGLRAGQRIAIHACKTPEALELCGTWPFSSYVARPDELPLGAIVALATIHDWEPTNALASSLGVPERQFGDYQRGRYASQLTRVEALKQPIPFKGPQGTFDVPVELLRRHGAVQVGDL